MSDPTTETVRLLTALGVSQDELLDKLADRCVGLIYAGDGDGLSYTLSKKIEKAIHNEIEKIAATQIREHVNEVLLDVMSRPIRRTNAYGEPIGEPMPLREAIVTEATRWLETKVNARGEAQPFGSDRDTTRAIYLMRQAVNSAVGPAMKAEIDKIASEVRSSLGDEAKKLITDAVNSIVSKAMAV